MPVRIWDRYVRIWDRCVSEELGHICEPGFWTGNLGFLTGTSGFGTGVLVKNWDRYVYKDLGQVT